MNGNLIILCKTCTWINVIRDFAACTQYCLIKHETVSVIMVTLLAERCAAVESASQQIAAACLEAVVALVDIHGVCTSNQDRLAKVALAATY